MIRNVPYLLTYLRLNCMQIGLSQKWLPATNLRETLYELCIIGNLRLLVDSEFLPSRFPICGDKTTLALFIVWCSRLRAKLTAYLHLEQIKNAWNSTSVSQARRSATFLRHGDDTSCVICNQKLKYMSCWCCSSFVADENRSIQVASGGKFSILGGHTIGHSEQKSVYVLVSYSERFPR
jgi:hypothetical protein